MMIFYLLQACSTTVEAITRCPLSFVSTHINLHSSSLVIFICRSTALKAPLIASTTLSMHQVDASVHLSLVQTSSIHYESLKVATHDRSYTFEHASASHAILWDGMAFRCDCGRSSGRPVVVFVMRLFLIICTLSSGSRFYVSFSLLFLPFLFALSLPY
jgi:hypothetical protein